MDIPSSEAVLCPVGVVPEVVLSEVHNEVKRAERLNLGEVMSQAVRNTERFHKGTLTLFHRRGRQPACNYALVGMAGTMQATGGGSSRGPTPSVAGSPTPKSA